MGALALLAAVGAGVDLAAFDTVVDDLGLAWHDALLVFKVVVDPKAEDKEKAGSEIEEVEDFHIELDHGAAWVERDRSRRRPSQGRWSPC